MSEKHIALAREMFRKLGLAKRKLSMNAAISIRAAYKSGARMCDLERSTGVDYATIKGICYNRYYKEGACKTA